MLLSWSRLIGKLRLYGDYLHQANVVQRNPAFLKSQVFVFPNPPCFKTCCLHPWGIYCTSFCIPPGSESLTLQSSSPHFTLVVGADNGGFILKPSPSFLSLLLTSSIRILPLPQKFVRLDHLLRSLLSRPQTSISKITGLLIIAGQEPRYRIIQQPLMLK